MFASEATNLLDGLSELKAEVRDIALEALRDYYQALEQKNNPVFTQVAKIMTKEANDSYYGAVNDEYYGHEEKKRA